MKLDIKDKTGSDVGEMEVRDDVFCVPENKDLVHQVFVSQLFEVLHISVEIGLQNFHDDAL